MGKTLLYTTTSMDLIHIHSHTHTVEQNKSDKEQYTLYDPIYIKVKNKQK